MKKCLLFTLALFCISINSQSLTNLNTRYGIGKFKLETPFSLYSTDLVLQYDGVVKYYKYTRGDVKKILTYDVDTVILGYYKNKLYFVGLIFDSEYHHSDLVLQKLINLFGSPTSSDKNYTTGPIDYVWGNQWKTSKVTLNYDKKVNGEIFLRVQSETLQKFIDNDEF